MSRKIHIIDLQREAAHTVSVVAAGEIRRAEVEPHVDAIALAVDLPGRTVLGTRVMAAQLRPPGRIQ